MSATIHTLPRNPPSGGGAGAVRPVAVELRDICLARLDELARQMFDNADDVLFEMGERATTDTERRGYFDTMRILRLDRSRVLQAFLKRLGEGFIAMPANAAPVPAMETGELAIQATEETEERIALVNLAGKVENRCKELIYELGRRIQAARELGIAIPAEALAPARICDAFGIAAGTLDCAFEVKLVLYKLFDRLLSRELDSVYQAALDVFARHGIAAQKSGAARATPAAAFARLSEQGLDPGRLRESGDPAAARLADALQGWVDRDGGLRAETATERLAMAGHLFDELIAQPHLGEALRAALEPLRYPLYRRALHDPALFTSPAHPLRLMLADLVDLAAATQTGEAPTSRLRSALAAAIGHTDNSGHVAGTTLAGEAAPDWNRFIADLKAQTESRRSALLLHVRRLVLQELELRMVGRVLDAPVESLLRSGLGPLLAVRLLRHGRGSAEYRQAENLLDRILASVETEAGSEAERAAREPLVTELAMALRSIGLPETRLDELIGGLRGSYRRRTRPVERGSGEDLPLSDLERARLIAPFEGPLGDEAAADAQRAATRCTPPAEAPIEAAIPAAAPAAEATSPETAAASAAPGGVLLEPLQAIAIPENWFRVWDAARGETRWLKLASFHPAQDSVSFAGFDEASRLCLRASTFLQDLAASRSEPINPGAAARAALLALRTPAAPAS